MCVRGDSCPTGETAMEIYWAELWAEEDEDAVSQTDAVEIR